MPSITDKSSDIELPERITVGNTMPREVSTDRNQSLLTMALQDLKVGESIDVSHYDITTLRVNVSNYGRRHGKHFSIRRYGNGHRLWRISASDRRQK